jgi:hypothetical protein
MNIEMIIMDDPLSYEIPEEPTVEHLARVIITDFAVFESASESTPEDNPISARLSASPTSVYNRRQKMVSGYANGSKPINYAVQALRWTYRQELDALEPIEAKGMLDALANRRVSYLRKLLEQPDEFFIHALEFAKPVLKSLTGYAQME